MIQFRGEYKELGGLPFLMELRDGPDNVLQIVIAVDEPVIRLFSTKLEP